MKNLKMFLFVSVNYLVYNFYIIFQCYIWGYFLVDFAFYLCLLVFQTDSNSPLINCATSSVVEKHLRKGEGHFASRVRWKVASICHCPGQKYTRRKSIPYYPLDPESSSPLPPKSINSPPFYAGNLFYTISPSLLLAKRLCEWCDSKVQQRNWVGNKGNFV